jgi:hypothetical protein
MLAEKFYAGIGSRDVPDDIGKDMQYIAEVLEQNRFTLRSGGAEGSDQWFQSGVDDNAQIWLPWAGFSGGLREEYPNHTYMIISERDKEAFDSVNKFHPSATNLSRGARSLMARNYRQIAGKTYPNSKFVICWTKDGADVGGTSQALRIAKSLKIPIYNLFTLTRDEILDMVLDS